MLFCSTLARNDRSESLRKRAITATRSRAAVRLLSKDDRQCGSGLDVQGIVRSSSRPRARRPRRAEHGRGPSSGEALGARDAALCARELSGHGRRAERRREVPGPLGDPVEQRFFSSERGATAAPGSYSIEVEQLAQAQKLQSRPSLSTSTVVGTGTLTISDRRRDLRRRNRFDERHRSLESRPRSTLPRPAPRLSRPLSTARRARRGLRSRRARAARPTR